MNLRDLISDLNALINRGVHPLTPTDALSVSYCPANGINLGSIWEDELRERIKEVEKERNDLEKDYDTESIRVTSLGHELARAQETLDRIADEEEKGATFREFEQRAEQAEERARKWKAVYEEMEQELAALRKRKGLMAGYYKNANAVMAYLHDSQDPKAQELVKKIHESK